jgi:PKD repeat protein
MSGERTKNGGRVGKIGMTALLLGLLLVGLAACRGFFGQGPIALMVVDNGGDTELPVVVWFDISGSNDPDGIIASYTLDFGDGTTDATGVDVSVPISHTYIAAGTFTVLLTVTDTDGRIGMTNGTVAIGPVMITFAADRSTNYDVYRMRGDGADQGAVLVTGFDELFPDLVRGTRDKIAYAAEDGTTWNVWTMNVLGGSRTPLTTQTESNQIQPTWSRDGATIAYASNAAATPSSTTWEIYTMTAAGADSEQLTTQAASWAIAPSSSPVNGDILFVSDSDDEGGTAAGGSAVWLWDVSADEAVILKDGPGRDGDASPALAGLATSLNLPAGAGISRPVWSPDGTKVAYAAEATAGGQIDIYVMDADGSDSQTLEEYVDDLGVLNTNISTGDDEFCPYWLEDGSGVVFAADDGTGDYQLYKVTVATGVVTQLTEVGANISPTAER